MEHASTESVPTVRLDSGLVGLSGIAAFFRIPADAMHLAREIALGDRESEATDIVRAANHVGLKARILGKISLKRLLSLPTPALARMRSGGFVVLGGALPSGLYRTVDPITRLDR